EDVLAELVDRMGSVPHPQDHDLPLALGDGALAEERTTEQHDPVRHPAVVDHGGEDVQGVSPRTHAGPGQHLGLLGRGIGDGRKARLGGTSRAGHSCTNSIRVPNAPLGWTKATMVPREPGRGASSITRPPWSLMA